MQAPRNNGNNGQERTPEQKNPGQAGIGSGRAQEDPIEPALIQINVGCFTKPRVSTRGVWG
jgi:hypothetical protein